MKNSLLISAAISSALLITACSPAKKDTAENTPAASSAATTEQAASMPAATTAENTPASAPSASTAATPEIAAFYGNWVEPNPINDKEVQGFSLNQDLTAKSINMETLQYQSWEYKEGNLSLVAKSVGNKQSSVDTTVYKVISVDENTLVIQDRDLKLTYTKQK
ncbi:lipocalin-like protein [Acinetobacter calcoaceticus]|uniref:Lipocalin-like protein n=1 Tax=Acinetobacter calcoaceticus TaxID=471 RepID=A0A4R1XZC5_ACICA|nr:lipocalin-like protein [Acinetobacter calcoaceticus]